MKAEVTELRSQTGQQSIFPGAIVIGAGAAGLAAHVLKKAGVPTLVLEKESRAQSRSRSSGRGDD
ncbi:FAD-dependent monooxygenase [Mesorhizobium ventifaucium]|nr:FAD-dependent monooxygenase [Mesorhizobium ventifaucium]